LPLLAASALLLCLPAFCAPPEAALAPPPAAIPASEQPPRLGSADKLIGTVCGVAIFISTPQNRWTADEKRDMRAIAREAEGWIVRQAHRRHVPLHMNTVFFGGDKDVSVDWIPVSDQPDKDMANMASYKANARWLTSVLSAIGFSQPLDLWEWTKKTMGSDNMHVWLFVKTPGRSYAMPFVQGSDPVHDWVECTMIYSSYRDGQPTTSRTIAHETLHLYGAWDLYLTASARRPDIADHAQQIYPEDVMLGKYPDLEDMDVGALTAYLIGWGAMPKEEYDWFRPVDVPETPVGPTTNAIGQ